MHFKETTLLHSLDFPTTVTHFTITPECLVSVGSYKPVVKIHTLQSKDIKNERNIENEPVCVVPLEDDCSKLAILRDDRYVEFHAKYGHYTSLRIPRIGRGIVYNRINANLYIQSDRNVQMFDLEVGKFADIIGEGGKEESIGKGYVKGSREDMKNSGNLKKQIDTNHKIDKLANDNCMQSDENKLNSKNKIDNNYRTDKPINDNCIQSDDKNSDLYSKKMIDDNYSTDEDINDKSIQSDDINSDPIITSIHMSVTNSLLALGTNKNIKLYDMRNNQLVREIDIGCNSLFLHENGFDICYGNTDVMLADLRGKGYKHKISNSKTVKCVKCYGKLFYAMDCDKILVSDGVNTTHINETMQNCFDVDENVLFTGGENGCIKTYYNSENDKYPTWCTRMDFI